MKYGNITTEEPDENGRVKRTTEGWYDGKRNSVKIETREDFVTSQQTLLKDVITHLEALKTDTTELVLVIKKDKYGYPARISKTWTVYKEKKK